MFARKMLAATLILSISAALGLASAASAGPTLDRIKTSGAIRCGAAARPGLFEPGAPRGLLVDLCRAFGVAAAGASVSVEMDVYDADASYDAVRSRRDDVFFLTGAEIVDQKLAGHVLPGPIVFTESSALMVTGELSFQHPSDLSGQPICFLQGDVSHRQLEAFFAARRLPFIRMGYQEEVELYDAFDAQVCHALAGEATTLAQVRGEGGAHRRGGRILAEPLASFPILAATGLDDGAWSAAVAFTFATLLDAEIPSRDWAAGGVDSLPLDGAALGLAAEWRQSVLAATGSYAAMLKRNVGEASPLQLPAGTNGLAEQGGLIMPLYAQ